MVGEVGQWTLPLSNKNHHGIDLTFLIIPTLISYVKRFFPTYKELDIYEFLPIEATEN